MIVFNPDLSRFADTRYALTVSQALIPPTFVPLTHVVSLSSIGPRFSIRSLPAQLSGRLKVLPNQTTPSKSGNPAASQFVGKFIGFQLVAANDGSDQFG